MYTQEVLSPLLLPDRGAKPGWYQGDKENGALYFLEKTQMPAIIIEPGFFADRAGLDMESACRIIADSAVAFVGNRL